jgi:hypothetical protein
MTNCGAVSTRRLLFQIPSTSPEHRASLAAKTGQPHTFSAAASVINELTKDVTDRKRQMLATAVQN